MASITGWLRWAFGKKRAVHNFHCFCTECSEPVSAYVRVDVLSGRRFVFVIQAQCPICKRRIINECALVMGGDEED